MPNGEEMSDQEIRQALRGVNPEAVARFLEGTGWTLQDTDPQGMDWWTKMRGDAVREVWLPGPESHQEDIGEHPAAAERIRRIAQEEGLSVAYLLHRIAPGNMGAPTALVITEDIARSGVRQLLTDHMAGEALRVMERRLPDDPPELGRLLWQAHQVLTEATGLLEQVGREHAGRLGQATRGREE